MPSFPETKWKARSTSRVSESVAATEVEVVSFSTDQLSEAQSLYVLSMKVEASAVTITETKIFDKRSSLRSKFISIR